MGRWINGFLDNESTFGRIMTRFGIIIGANLMFVLFSLPVITIGPAACALFYVMLKTLHSDDSLNPFTTFWKGFRMNLKQGILCFLMAGAAGGILILDIRYCRYAGGNWKVFMYACFGLLFLLIVLLIYLIPVMASFDDTIPHLLRNAVFFAARRPQKIPLAAVLVIVPALVTVLDTRMRPLYGFIFSTFGFGLIAMMISELLIRDIEKYLPHEETEENKTEKNNSLPTEAGQKTQRQILREQKRLEK